MDATDSSTKATGTTCTTCTAANRSIQWSSWRKWRNTNERPKSKNNSKTKQLLSEGWLCRCNSSDVLPTVWLTVQRNTAWGYKVTHSHHYQFTVLLKNGPSTRLSTLRTCCPTWAIKYPFEYWKHYVDTFGAFLTPFFIYYFKTGKCGGTVRQWDSEGRQQRSLGQTEPRPRHWGLVTYSHLLHQEAKWHQHTVYFFVILNNR